MLDALIDFDGMWLDLCLDLRLDIKHVRLYMHVYEVKLGSQF